MSMGDQLAKRPEERRAMPAFRLMADRLTEEILGGRVAGDLPSEKDLAAAYGVSRMTARKALSVVAEAGLVEVRWGRGWSVAHGPLSEPANALLSVTELASRRHLEVRSVVLSSRIESAGMDDAERLQIAPGAGLYVLDRVRLNDDVPFTRQVSKLPAERVIGIQDVDFSNSSLYDTLRERWGINPTRADYAVEARPADTENARLLNVSEGSPLLWATQDTCDQGGRLIEIGWSAYPWDRYRFRATLSRSSSEPPHLRR